jgi:hypothetical protein
MLYGLTLCEQLFSTITKTLKNYKDQNSNLKILICDLGYSNKQAILQKLNKIIKWTYSP